MTYVPEISFASTTPDQLIAAILARIEVNLGRSLAPADPVGLLARTFAAEDIILRNLLDEAARQTLLAYATGANLDALADLVGVTRLSAVAATCTVRFSAAAAAEEDIPIAAGTRVAPSGDLYFETDLVATLLTGNTYVDVPVTCQTAGDIGNGYLAGQITRIVDPVAGIATVSNTDETHDGVDTEGDEPLRVRIRLAPTQFSVAGPRDAYEFWARSASAAVTGVWIESPDPGEVDIYIIEGEGQIPSAELLALVESVCSADTVRPLTDLVTAKAPGETAYTTDITYYIRTADAARAAEIQTAVEAAVDAWIAWTRAEIGRDINPSELISRVVQAGAKRLTVTSPAYTAITTAAIGTTGAPTITYGGLEDE